jgi:thiamine-monophosphate kinase
MPKRATRTTPDLGEFSAIELLARLLRSSVEADSIELGIGDDAAILRVGSEHLVWTVDASIEGVHFDRRWLTLRDVGWRSFHAAASDLAAMAARPLAALSSLTLPSGFNRAELTALGRGQAEAARSLSCPVIGGNIARGSELGITTTLLGIAKHPLRRSGAREGDELWLVGGVGLAAMGFRLLARGSGQLSLAERRCVRAWQRPRALVEEGQRLARCAHAAMDVSDGLAGDAAHLARASGVRVEIDGALLEAALPKELSLSARRSGLRALDVALAGGEDYALLAAGPSKKRPPCARCIGKIVAGRGVFIVHANGEREALGPGFDHLATGRRRASRRL